MRSILFCNEMLGLGHVRLSLAIAQELAGQDERSTALVVTGSTAHGVWSLPAGVDTLKLPTAPVGADSRWSATGRRPPAGLRMEPGELRDLRSRLCRQAVAALRPGVAVVDYKPLGRGGELLPALELLRQQRDRTVALGLWEVDDDPERLREDWTEELLEAVARLYDLALVYGPEAGGDVRVEALRAAGVPVHHTGRVGAAPGERSAADLGEGYLLVAAGGGVDGFPLLDAVLGAIAAEPLPVEAVLVTGPMMAAHEVADLRSKAEGLNVRIEEFRADMDAVLAGARAVVAMGGYSTVAEVLGTGLPALLVPRAFPRAEQLNRARRLAEEGTVRMLEPARLEPNALRAELAVLLEQLPGRVDPLSGARDAARVLAGGARAC